MKQILYTLLFALLSLSFFSCGESAEEISLAYDHEVPKYHVVTDSLLVVPLQEIDLKVEISDNEGLKKIVLTYGNWGINKVSDLEENPKNYTFETRITIPENAEKEWKEQITKNDGTIISVEETYHKLIITATDINMNVRNIPVYLRIQ